MTVGRTSHQPRVVGFVVATAVILCFAVLPLASFAAGKNWQTELEDSIVALLSGLDSEAPIFIEVPVDSSRESAYYPFASRLQSLIVSRVLRGGYHSVPSPLAAKYYLRTKFNASSAGLALTPSLVDAASGALTATMLVDLPAATLPVSWNQRTLRDIAHELAAKLARARGVLFRSNLPVVIEKIVGGTSADDGFISEFGIAMRGYIREELGRFNNLQPMTMAAGAVPGINAYRLTGHYQVSGNNVIVRLALLDTEAGFEVANVSSRFAVNLVPSTLRLLPPNDTVAARAEDPSGGDPATTAGTIASTEPGQEKEKQLTQLAIWTNKEDPVYFNDDTLIVYLKPEMDLYAKVYYVQSDGGVCEIFPIKGGDGFLKGGEVKSIGDQNDLVELVISDETVGQEVVKVFTSSAPIDDRNIPKEFIDGPNVFCMEGDYGSLTKALTRALKKRARVRPAAELKILVSKD